MKKVLAAGLAAMALVLMAQQQASAWHKCSFGVGLNLACEGGGNNVFWGALKGANTPGQMDGYFDPHHNDGHAFAAPEMAPGLAMPFNPADVFQGPAMAAPKPMPTGMPSSAQPVGYFPVADPAVGYYPRYTYPAYTYPMYYYYPTYAR